MARPWLTQTPGGVELAVLVQPRASRSRVVGEHDGLLKIQLAAPPVEGEANAALIEMLARLLGVPKRQVSLISGETSRRKRVRIEGVEPAAAEAVMTPVG
jgi:uncharacterized protein (TIGR00251 family)